MDGPLSKWTNVVKGWQYRYFVLDYNAGLLSYYTSREKMIRGNRRGCVRLKGAMVGIDDQDNTTFTITVDGKTFHFQARNSQERETWIRALEDTIVRHAYRNITRISTPSMSSVTTSKTQNEVTNNTLSRFDRKVVEADAYLQIIIDQTKSLEMKMKELTSESEKKILSNIIAHTNSMLEAVKHTIVLLQIAKNSTFPVNGIYKGPQNRINQDSSSGDGKVVMAPSSETSSLNSVQLVRHHSLPLDPDYIVPAVSYSSSEDESFYDACEYGSDDNNSIANNMDLVSDNSSQGSRSQASEGAALSTKSSNSIFYTSNSRRHSNGAETSSNTSKLIADETVDYDALYEDTSENDLSLESHGSVIKHLLSQVKIGMDLTKVVLPTFILERRSLLEMYADYFAHPDIFLKAAELDTPKERFIQIVKWYLSSFHAGRQKAVAKKPYNPILGEVFQCWWNLPSETGEEKPNPPNESGPIPWCGKNQLVFIAEQVSHHPPISAFYVEHFEKKVSLCAHIWTKSKFLGLSVGVHNIGQASVHLHQFNEEYISTFPNGYGRSILTVPWIELGGSTTIKCPQTGYACNVEFLTKPFYGGKRHRISAELYGPTDKKPFMTINGEWNGVMETKTSDGKSEVFVDTKSLNIIKKRVRRIEEQAENESRNIWKYVTLGLKYNNVENATNAKLQIEQKQREEALNRKESNESWNPQWFYEENGVWMYKNPLEKRLTENKA